MARFGHVGRCTDEMVPYMSEKILHDLHKRAEAEGIRTYRITIDIRGRDPMRTEYVDVVGELRSIRNSGLLQSDEMARNPFKAKLEKELLEKGEWENGDAKV